MKKIAIFTNHFSPENFKVNDIALELSKHHSVTVITQIPNYPKGDYFPGYSLREKRVEQINDNLKVVRLMCIPRKKSKVMLLLNYMSFHMSSFFYSLKKRDFDHVFVYITSPIFVANAAVRVSRKANASIDMYLLDLWPDNLYAMLPIKGRFYRRYFDRMCRLIYNAMGHIFVPSKQFIPALHDLGVDTNKVVFVPQHETRHGYSEPHFEPHNINILFAGNLGEAQGLELLVSVAKELQLCHAEYIHFNLVGEGRFKSSLQQMIQTEGVASYFTFYDKVAPEQLNVYYEENAFGLVVLKNNETLNKHLPLKVQSYMSAGMPVLALAGGETARVIRDVNAGVVIESNDAKVIAKHLQEMTSLTLTEHREKSKNAYSYALQNYTLERVMRQIEKDL